MIMSKFFQSYFQKNLNEIAYDQKIPQKIRFALERHWSGDLRGALEILSEFNANLPVPAEFLEFVRAEILLLNAKLGIKEVFNDYDVSSFQTKECRYIAEYALFSLMFWIDHKIARKSLWRLLGISLTINLPGSTLMVIFLMLHLAAISGWKRTPFHLASRVYFETIKNIINDKPSFFQNIVIAAYPYTIFVSNKINENLVTVLSFGEKYLPLDPYYRTLFNVSGLYCYAYSGDVTRTEIYVSRLEEAQKQGNLLRYKPISNIMKFLPFALRGYGFLVMDEFKSLMASKEHEDAHTVIASQFYRAASIIYLSLGEFQEANKAIELAIVERKKSNSFAAWETFDNHILKLAQKRQTFNPHADPVLSHQLNFENNSQFMRFFVDLMSIVATSVMTSEEQFYEELKGKLIEHLAHDDIFVLDFMPDREISNPAIKIGKKYFVFMGVPKEREIFIRSILNSMGPISLIIMNSFYSQKRAQEFEKIKSFSTIAKQVSHDIRSPLSALTMVMGTIQNIKEDKRLLMRNATQRINDIANQLLSKAQFEDGTQNKFQDSKITPELLPSILDVIVSEKRTQFREKIGIEIEIDLRNSYGAFVNINSAEFKRVISNLINNSVEAFFNSVGKILVTLNSTVEQVILTIEDNGSGIPENILEKLGQQGFSYGKSHTDSGAGLGIYHAKKTVESFGGSFGIESKLGEGTRVVLSFKKAQAPNWFIEKLNLKGGETIVCLDDDVSIHQIWQGRFNSLKINPPNYHVVQFSSGDDLIKWVNENSYKLSQTMFLVDYELLDQNLSGLDLIEKLDIGNQSILVTSRFEESHIRTRCEKLNVKLIPKGMASLVPISTVKSRQKYDACLIDDDSIVRMTWRLSAKEKEASVLVFESYDEFLKHAESIDSQTPIYIDQNLADGVKGTDVAIKLSNIGFNKLILATGYEPDQVTEVPPCILNIVGKDPVL